MHNLSIQKKMDSSSVHPPKNQVLFSQIPSAVQPVDHIPYIILKSVHYLTRRCTPACHADDQKQLGGKCCTQQKHPYFFIAHSPLMAFMPFCLSIITILLDSLLVLSVQEKDVFCCFCFFLKAATQKRPGFHYGSRGGSFGLFVLFQALTRSLAGVLDSSLSGCQNYRALGIILLPPSTAQRFLLN